MGFLSKRMDKRIASYQHELIETHYREVDNMYRQIRGWRHDYRNHIQTMKAYAAAGDWDAVKRYLDLLDDDLATVDTVIKTGNHMTDAILNSKISLAKSKGIKVVADAHIPVELKSSEIDLCCIIGNLFDNAIEASVQLRRISGLSESIWIEEYSALHIVYQFYCRTQAAKGRKAVSQHKGRRPWIGACADRLHRRAPGRIYQPQQRGWRIYDRDTVAAGVKASIRPPESTIRPQDDPGAYFYGKVCS